MVEKNLAVDNAFVIAVILTDFALPAVPHRSAYLTRALSALLIFIGGEIFFADLMGWSKVPAEGSPGETLTIPCAGIVYSIWRTPAAASDTAA